MIDLDEFINLFNDEDKQFNLDDENISDIFELKKLDMFKYLLIPKQNKNYDIIKSYENRLNNILIYE